MTKNIYIKPETEVVAAYTQENILKESKYYIKGGAWNDGYDNGDGGNNGGLDIDAKGNNMWDGWED